jgi:hypothetical protein
MIVSTLHKDLKLISGVQQIIWTLIVINNCVDNVTKEEPKGDLTIMPKSTSLQC